MVKRAHKDQHLAKASFTPQQHVLIWIAGIVLCMFVGLIALEIDLSRKENKFQEKADSIYEEINRRYSTLEAVLTSLAGFHQASDNVSEVQFSTFAQELLSAYPYIRSALSLHKLDQTGRSDFEGEMQDRGYFQFSVMESTSDGKIVQAGQRHEYLIINVIEPLLPHMGSLLGYNVLSNPELTEAVTIAAKTGAGIASPVTNLLNRDGGIIRDGMHPIPNRNDLQCLMALSQWKLAPKAFLATLFNPHRNYVFHLSRSAQEQIST